MTRLISRRNVAFAVVATIIGAGCVGAATGVSGALMGSSGPTTPTVRLGYFANITHAPALVGVERGIIAEHLGAGVRLQASTFKAGGEVTSALFSDSIDAAYVGPIPALNGFSKSDGQALRIIAGATSGGAFLVVRPGITVDSLQGTKIATPQLGNTQDVALRAWLKEHGYTADEFGAGDVSVLPQDNSMTLNAFKTGQIDGAWVPEPWATRLVQEGGANVLLDERDLWPGGRYATTNLVVSTKFLNAHPDLVKKLLEGHVATLDYIADHPEEAKQSANDQIEAITGKRIKPAVLDAAWGHLEFTADPLASTLPVMARNLLATGLVKGVSTEGIYWIAPLNEVLRSLGRATVSDR
jgi:NitT/TauT family transport system substrate-binding protein